MACFGSLPRGAASDSPAKPALGLLGPIGLALQVGGALVKGEAIRKAGSRAKDALFEQASEIEIQANQLGARALEEQEDITRQTRADVGASRTAAGKSGVRVGAGSTKRAEEKIIRIRKLQKERIRRRASESISTLNRRADRLRKRGGEVKAAAKTRQFTSFLGSGFQVASNVGKFDLKNVFGGSNG